MNTTKITIKPHLAEYCIGKWGVDFSEPVMFPSNTDLYVAIYDLLQKRPANYYNEIGNLTIAMPSRREDSNGMWKNPNSYNYLSEKSCKIIQDKIELIFWCELHQELTQKKHDDDQNYEITAHFFICRYRIESITTDALIKNHKRWRDSSVKRQKRKYKRKKSVKL